MLTIFASMLYERRILITSKKLSRLSACVQAANSLIYPMFWQVTPSSCFYLFFHPYFSAAA